LTNRRGRIATVVIEHKEDLHPQIEIRNGENQPLAAYSMSRPVRTSRSKDGEKVASPAACWPRRRAKASKTKDITGGLPRVAELFEARRPKDAAEMARDRRHRRALQGNVRGKRKLVVRNEAETGAGGGASHSDRASTSIVQPGDLRAAEDSTSSKGSAGPHEILEVLRAAASCRTT
jgi:DNA-directed RNA polymerase subunit beta'